MLGLLFGVVAALGYVTSAVNGTLAQQGGTALALTGLGLAVAAVILGQFFRLTIGVAAMWAMLGAGIAAVIEFIQGHPGPGLALLLNAGLLWGVQQVLARPLLTPPVARWGPPQSRAARGQRAALWDSAPGYAHDVLPLAPTGRCLLALHEDGSATLAAENGRLEIDDVKNSDWRMEDPADLPFHPALDPSRRAFVMRVASLEIAVQPADVAAWRRWFEDHGAGSPVPHEDPQTAAKIQSVLDEGESIRASSRGAVRLGREQALGGIFITTRHLVLDRSTNALVLPLDGIEVAQGESPYALKLSYERTRPDGAGIDLLLVGISSPSRDDNQAFLRVASLLRQGSFCSSDPVWLREGDEVVYGQVNEGWIFLPARYLECLHADIEALAKITTEADLRAYRPKTLRTPDLVRGDDPQPGRLYDGRAAVARLPHPITPTHAVFVWGDDDEESPYAEFELIDSRDGSAMMCQTQNLQKAIAALRRDGYIVRQDQAAFDRVEGLALQATRAWGTIQAVSVAHGSSWNWSGAGELSLTVGCNLVFQPTSKTYGEHWVDLHHPCVWTSVAAQTSDWHLEGIDSTRRAIVIHDHSDGVVRFYFQPSEADGYFDQWVGRLNDLGVRQHPPGWTS